MLISVPTYHSLLILVAGQPGCRRLVQPTLGSSVGPVLRRFVVDRFSYPEGVPEDPLFPVFGDTRWTSAQLYVPPSPTLVSRISIFLKFSSPGSFCQLNHGGDCCSKEITCTRMSAGGSSNCVIFSSKLRISIHNTPPPPAIFLSRCALDGNILYQDVFRVLTPRSPISSANIR